MKIKKSALARSVHAELALHEPKNNTCMVLNIEEVKLVFNFLSTENEQACTFSVEKKETLKMGRHKKIVEFRYVQ